MNKKSNIKRVIVLLIVLLGIYLVFVVISLKNEKNDLLNSLDSLRLEKKEKDELLKEMHDRSETLVEKKVDTAAVSFIGYQKEGLILPGVYKIYSGQIEILDNLNIAKIERIEIIELSKNKHSELADADYCDWANYLKIKYKNDTLIVFGNTVLEVSEKYDHLNLEREKVDVLVANDFRMKAEDSDGLTGCEDYHYLILKSNEWYTFINPSKATFKSTYEYAVLFDNDGVGERIKKVTVNKDTITLNIEQFFQEGSGKYKLKIYQKDDAWESFKMDEIRSN